ncbi:histone H3-K9 methyltransferase [Parasponia andersonii]|uniref:Histone H3-K9 methyltransferase n=1 Tax=Parasponia andersonii TaxID=3476 RepID=A0A2P5BHS3_PARAD|nr:histone H3-K9 methyltransferase [Parasponia andersonii]
MESGECPLLVRSSTESKRRKVSAIRDLPYRRCKGYVRLKTLTDDNVENSKNATCDLVMHDKLISTPNGCNDNGNGNGLVKAMARKYPTRRAVSAIREFPQLYGRSVVYIGGGESFGVVDSLKTESSGQGKCGYGMDEKMLMNGVKTDVKQPEGDGGPKEESKEVVDYQEKKTTGQGKSRRGREKSSGVERLNTKIASGRKLNGNDSNRKSRRKNPLQVTCQGAAHPAISDEENSLERSDYEDLQVAPLSCEGDAVVPHLCRGVSRSKDRENDGGGDTSFTRNKVLEMLSMFRKLLQEDKVKSNEARPRHKRVDYQVAKILQDKYNILNIDKQILGRVPGVVVGDEFKCRMELSIIGLHRQTQSGINFVKQGAKTLATSIVASEDHTDVLDNSNILIYTGQGGTVMYSDKKPEDQKLESGNLALKNSITAKNPIRVIRGCDPYKRRFRKFLYIGLYLVENYWKDVGPHGNLVFKFQLERIPGQPEVIQKEEKRKRSKVNENGVNPEDISQGKEVIPIRAVNTIDDEKPPPFEYRTKLTYPDWCHFTPPKGCDCIGGCSDSRKCLCAVKNGGEIPYNSNGAVVEAKPLVYECGPCCKCPPSCHNRVSQHGIKFKLEVFKTKSRGWGLRSQNFIPSGSFICEYVGELLKEEEAEKRTDRDEYLFDIGKNYDDKSLCNEEVEDEGGFTIDAADYGNAGRFINHSCTPNLYAQNILFDHEDKSIPHVMFFATEKIPPLQELTYDYNYIIDQVRDSSGNIKKKSCFCGSPECTGRLY